MSKYATALLKAAKRFTEEVVQHQKKEGEREERRWAGSQQGSMERTYEVLAKRWDASHIFCYSPKDGHILHFSRFPFAVEEEEHPQWRFIDLSELTSAPTVDTSEKVHPILASPVSLISYLIQIYYLNYFIISICSNSYNQFFPPPFVAFLLPSNSFHNISYPLTHSSFYN